MAEIDLTEPPEDRELLAELGETLRAADPVPDQWRFAAVGSFAWRSVDAELAELTFDSLVASGPTLVRGAATCARILVFEAAVRRVEIEVVPTGPGRYRVTGQLVPESAGTVELRQEAGSVIAEADLYGRFQADGVAPGPLSLRCSVAGGTGPVDTAWLTI